MNQLSLFEVKVKKIKIVNDFLIHTPNKDVLNLKHQVFTALTQNHSALFFYEASMGYHIRIDNTLEDIKWTIVG